CGNESLVPLYNDITSRLRGIRDTVTWDATQVAFMSRVLASYQGCGVNNFKPQLCAGNFVPQMFGAPSWKSLAAEIEGFKKSSSESKFVAFLTKLNKFMKDSDTEEQKLLGERVTLTTKVKTLTEAATERSQRYAESAAVQLVQSQLKTEHAELVKTRKDLKDMRASNTDINSLRTQVASLTEKIAETKISEASRYADARGVYKQTLDSTVQEKIALAGELEEANKIIDEQNEELKKSETTNRQLKDMTQQFYELDERTKREMLIAQNSVDSLRADNDKLNKDRNEYTREKNASEGARSEEKMSRDNSRNKMQDLKKEHLAAIDVLKKEHLAAIDVLKEEHL
ncbi:hypothetical protein T484DRAFT_1758663, partial [Baffinella frigidus]